MDNSIKIRNRWVVGDIHADYDKLLDVLFKSKFDYENDLLISLGDVVDRGMFSYQVVEELFKIKNRICIRGNHDATFRDSVETGLKNSLYNQGGRETMLSYTKATDCGDDPCKIPQTHKDFFLKEQVDYYIDEDHNCFVHGGFNRHFYIEDQTETTFQWDRDLFLAAMSFKNLKGNHTFKMKNKFNHVYVGHTPTVYWDSDRPITAANITNMDTGCGKGGFPLSMMNLETKEVFQSFK